MPQVNEHPEILLYTRIRKSPYYYASRRHGVQMYSVYNHTYHPRHYGDPVAEYWHLLNGVTLWDVGVERQIEISGPDAFDFTNLLVARDLNKCAVEQCKYVFLCLPDGGIINDPVLMRVEENRFLLSLADSDVELWARGVAHNSDFDVTIKEIDLGPVQVQGPKSKDVMVDLFGESILEIPYYYLHRYELDGMDVLVSRTGYTGELGYEIYLHEASRKGEKLWDAVLEAGKPHDLAVIGPCHIRRIEGGILALGADMWYDTNPYEVGMGYDWMVDSSRAPTYRQGGARADQAGGRQAQARRRRDRGRAAGAYNDGAMVDFFGVDRDGERIGKVTSAYFAPRLEKNIDYAMVPTEHSELGTELEVETPRERTSAVIVEKPFSDRRRRRRSRSSRARRAGRTDGGQKLRSPGRCPAASAPGESLLGADAALDLRHRAEGLLERGPGERREALGVDQVVWRLSGAQLLDLMLHARRAGELERVAEHGGVGQRARASIGSRPPRLMSGTPLRSPLSSSTKSRKKPVGGRSASAAAARRLRTCSRFGARANAAARRSATVVAPQTGSLSTTTESSIRPRSRSGSSSHDRAARSHSSIERANRGLEAGGRPSIKARRPA